MRAIDADALVEAVKDYPYGYRGLIVCTIAEQPTIEPELIRCKDCKHSDTFSSNSDADMPMKCLGIRYGGVYPDWYCEHSERREDEQTD